MDPVTPDLASLRAEYQLAGLDESDLAPDPYAMFRQWFEDVRAAGVVDPNAMVLSTVSSDGQPAARTVLLKGLTDHGFVFFTNYESRKARELGANPHCRYGCLRCGLTPSAKKPFTVWSYASTVTVSKAFGTATSRSFSPESSPW